MPVADHGSVPICIDDVLVIFNPGRNLGLDGLGEQAMDSVANDVGQSISGCCGWHRQRFGVTVH